MSQRTMTQAALAVELGVSRQMVSRYVQAGMPVGKDKRIDARAARRWIKANLAGKSGDGGAETFSGARARKEAALASLRELELQHKRGEVISTLDVALDVAEMLRALRDGMLSLPDRLGPRLAAEDDAATCVGLLRDEIRLLLTKLSTEFRSLQAARTEADEAASPTAPARKPRARTKA